MIPVSFGAASAPGQIIDIAAVVGLAFSQAAQLIPGNVLPDGTFELEFGGIRLHGYSTDLGDDIQHRFAMHEYDRTAGAEQEWMQRGPWRCRVTLVFAGDHAFSDAKRFLLLLETNPKQLLIHPIYGRRRAACSGAEGARLSAQTPNTYTMPVVFMEDSLRGSVLGAGAQGVPAAGANVNAQATSVTALADPYG